ncbi:hypothetical protein F5Y15DRAFT_430954 [Xylariaceae sp. FL0016]|nr:hypothetical protein F5Y15DRAFT_430954 [Xylariaceae sp. FL0016]
MLRQLCLLLVAFAASVPTATAQCNRTKLMGFADAYVAAHEKGQVSLLGDMADNFTYVENNKTRDINGSIFSNAFKIEHRHTIADVVDCASYTELIILRDASDAPTPHVIGTQIRHNPADMSCDLIDLLVSSPGSWLFNASQTLYWAQRENWTLIEEPRRNTRDLLRRSADAYLDMWSNKSAVDAVPWGTPCARLEGGAYTGNGSPTDSCKPGIPTNNSQAPNSHRRYVIDEAYGSVNVMCIFEHLKNAPDSHEFRLENGKLRYVHTITLADSGTTRPGRA